MKRAIVIHGHFYQPPRENPWLDIILKQPSASPYHDWNERVNAECYAPNSVSRILNQQGLITRLVNNYSRISFNFGPTLMRWLMKHSPSVYRRIISADLESRDRNRGHGNAIAQCYNHMIMPLANRQDKITQVLWGIKDFMFHFGRNPEGMWLPETAVDLETLDILAEQGIRFTILSPNQADRVKPIEGKRWKKINSADIDTSQPYLQRLPTGREIVIFFYNGQLSHQVAFGDLLKNGDTFARRLLSESTESADYPLVCIATDGETYGHHHKFAEMALSYGIRQIEDEKEAFITNFGSYLSERPPNMEVMIKENTSWSCVHGVERWRSDCGCSIPTQEGWTQQWRAPLREAVDFLRYNLIKTFQEYGEDLFISPWDARNHYIDMLLEPGHKDTFVKNNLKHPERTKNIEASLKLLEMQKNAMLMYTSCGWFFDEPSRPETIQILCYSLRAMKLHEEITSNSLLDDFLEILSDGKSNIPEVGSLADMFRERVMPLLIDIKDAALIGGFYFSLHPEKSVYKKGNLTIKRQKPHKKTEHHREKLHIEIAPSEKKAIIDVVVTNPNNPDAMITIGKKTYTLNDLLSEEREKYLEELINRKTEPLFSIQRRLYAELKPLFKYFNELPSSAKSILESLLRTVLIDILQRGSCAELSDILSILRSASLRLEAEKYEFLFRKFLERNFRMPADKMDISIIKEYLGCLEECREPGFSINLWTIQNIFYDMLSTHYKNKPLPEEVKRLGAFLSFDIRQIKEQIDSE